MTVHQEPAAMKVGYAKRKLTIRQVWAHNVEHEFGWIRSVADKFPYVSMDTEFPGVIYKSTKKHWELTPSERYRGIKSNVDELHLIQVGLAFAASAGSPPSIAFEINLREFDPLEHRHDPDSVSFLTNNGFDFAKHRDQGVDARDFAYLLMSSGLVCPGTDNTVVTWVTFHPLYDYGYLVKLLTGRMLPDTLPEFLDLVRVFFGKEVYDVKHIMSRTAACDLLSGSLDGISGSLGVHRVAGSSHHAGSDSVLTWDTFRRIRDKFYAEEGVRRFAGVLHGLEFDLDIAAAGDLAAPGGANGNG